MAKTKKNTSCDTCEYNNEDTMTCAREHKMTFTEFEDYFVDRIGRCPYYGKKQEDKKNG